MIKKDVDQFAEEANKFHPTIKFKAEISDEISSKNQRPVTHLLPQNSPLSKMADCYKREAWALGTSYLISTEEAHFHGGGSFLRRRLISTEEALFYGGGSFLRRRLFSTEEADFYEGGSFLRRKLLSTAEADFYGRG